MTAVRRAGERRGNAQVMTKKSKDDPAVTKEERATGSDDGGCHDAPSELGAVSLARASSTKPAA